MEDLVGKRIRMISMDNDPHPITPGTLGTVNHVGGGIVNVTWDDGRTLGVVIDVDKYELNPEE
jgi:hypothetical protein